MSDRNVRRDAPAVLDPLIVGVLGAAISLVGAGRPSFWYDEAATISASYSRSLGQLWQMLSNVDAVHGLYYVIMHGWFQIFPPTEFWSRAPSGLAVGGAATAPAVEISPAAKAARRKRGNFIGVLRFMNCLTQMRPRSVAPCLHAASCLEAGANGHF